MLVRDYAKALNEHDRVALVMAFGQFGFAVRKTTHVLPTLHKHCHHVVRSLIDHRKNHFLWDGVCHPTAVDALTAVLAYGKGTPFVSRQEGFTNR